VPSPASGWGATGEAAAPATPAGQGWGSGNSGAKDSEGRNVSSPWNAAQGEQAQQASGWSSAASQDIPSGSNDIWGKIAQSNVVDWARGGFGNAPAPAPAPPPRPSGSVAAANFIPPTPQAPENTTQPPTAAPPPASPPPPPPQAAPDGQALLALAQAAGVDPDKLSHGEQETLGVAGDLLRRLVSGLVVMLEARARAKAQLGAQGTSLEFDGNNPLKFARSPEQALAQLLNPPERGFMPTERAIEDAFKDLQAHQMATLMAMQGALRATLERFSPDSIRSRAENKGMLAKVLPTARDAELWKAYEKEFSGVAKGSDEAFMDVFAKEFKKAYEEVAKSR
jgi:type VI secretion system FHA domain protein